MFLVILKLTVSVQVKACTADELAKIIPAASLPRGLGGTVDYDNDAWVKFRCVSVNILGFVTRLCTQGSDLYTTCPGIVLQSFRFQ